MRIVVRIVLSLTIAGCAITPSIEHGVMNFNHAVAKTNDEIAFLNVLRSVERRPRHYTAIASLQGNIRFSASADLGAAINPGDVSTRGSNTTDVLLDESASASGETTTKSSATATTVSSLIRAGARNTFAPKLGTSVTTNPIFSVGVLESQEFYRGILSPIDVSTIALYANQGWDSELLMHIFVEGVWFRPEVGQAFYLENDSGSDVWRDLAKHSRLTATNFRQVGKGVVQLPDLTDEGVAALYQAGLVLKPCDSGAATCDPGAGPVVAGKDSTRITLQSRGLKEVADTRTSEEICDEAFDDKEDEAQRWIQLFNASSLNFSSENDTDQSYATSEVTCKAADVEIQIVTRSADGIVYYLGEYLRNLGNMCLGGADELTIGGDPLFRVCDEETLPGSAGLQASLLGKTWYIPADVSIQRTRSMQMLGLIQQLINLNKSSDELPSPSFIQVQ